jgi:uncharacterized membrane protein
VDPAAQAEIEATVDGGDHDGDTIQVLVPPEVAADGIHIGDHLRVLAIDPSVTSSQDAGALEGDAAVEGDELDELDQPDEAAPQAEIIYSYFDHERGIPVLVLFLAYLVVVALVARGHGLRAVIGLAAGVGVVVWFMLPAILGGSQPVLVALVAGSAMIFPCVYFAHGISVRTTTAVIGTFGGVAVTAVVALLGSRPAGMTGADVQSAQFLFGTDPTLSLPAIFTASVIISGLGALNDVTITQASSVWELRTAMPQASRTELFRSAMRIGRDHIASTVYTLAYAYIGSALPMLLLVATMDRSLGDLLTSGEIAAEVFRTLVASIGLVLAIPLTTAIATVLAGPTGRPASAVDQRPGPLSGRGRRA